MNKYTIGLAFFMILSCFGCNEYKDMSNDIEQIRYHAYRLSKYKPIEIKTPWKQSPPWKIKNRKLKKKYWR